MSKCNRIVRKVEIIQDLIKQFDSSPEDFLTKENKFFLLSKSLTCDLCHTPLRVMTKAKEARATTIFMRDQGALPGRLYGKFCISCKAVYSPSYFEFKDESGETIRKYVPGSRFRVNDHRTRIVRGGDGQGEGGGAP